MPEETHGKGLSHGKTPLFVPQVRGSLDFARDDGNFLYCHSEGLKKPEACHSEGLNSPKNLLERVYLLGRLTPSLWYE